MLQRWDLLGRALLIGVFAVSGFLALLGTPPAAQAAGCTQTTVQIPTFELVGPNTYQGAGTTQFTCTGDTITSVTANWLFATEGTCAGGGNPCAAVGDTDNEGPRDTTQFSFSFQVFSGAASGNSCSGASLAGPTTVTGGTVATTGPLTTTNDGTFCVQFVSSDPTLTTIANNHPGAFEVDVVDYGEFDSTLHLGSGVQQPGPNGNADAFISGTFTTTSTTGVTTGATTGATPELDSVVLFGVGVLALSGYGLYQRRRRVLAD
jgi:hypothetical protein